MPFMEYVEPLSFSITLLTAISEYLAHSLAALFSELSNKSSTLALEIAGRVSVPLKMTDSMDSPRSSFADDEPRTHFTDSMILDFPQPFGPTIPTNCPGREMVVGSTKVLKPANLICLNFKYFSLLFYKLQKNV